MLIGDIMILTMDIGNTDVVSICYSEEKEKLFEERVSLDDVNFKKDSFSYISDLVKRHNLYNSDYVVSCVVPLVKEDVENAFKKLVNAKGLFIDHTSYLGLTDSLEYPSDVGADLLAASAAVLNDDLDSIIVDMGSASKIILVKNKQLDSVAIMLGVKNNSIALASKISQLPEVEIEFNDKILGRNTIDAIQSGLMYSTLYGIKGYVEKIEASLGYKVNKYLTGGIANAFKNELSDFTFVADLVNIGLLEIYFKNMEEKR